MALLFGTQKINLQQQDREPDAHVMKPTPGSADFCLTTNAPIGGVIAHLRGLDIPMIDRPVARTDAVGAIESNYSRDPDLNLVQIVNYLE